MLSAETQVGEGMQFGIRGDSVAQLQRELTSIGYTLVDDGIFGKNTRSMVIQFQKDSALTADGIVGPLTHAAIQRAIKANNTNQQPGIMPNVMPAIADMGWGTLALLGAGVLAYIYFTSE